MADEIQVNVDIDKLTIKDLVMFEDLRKARIEMDLRTIYEVLGRVVVGGVDSYRAVDLWSITAAVLEEIGKARNPKVTAVETAVVPASAVEIAGVAQG